MTDTVGGEARVPVPSRPRQLGQGSGAVAVTCLGLLVLSLAAAVLAIVLREYGGALVLLFAALLFAVPTLIALTTWVAVHVNSRVAVIVVSLIAASAIVVTWLIHVLPGYCDLVQECDDDPRLLPAVIGTMVIVATWAVATLLRSRSTSGRPSSLWSVLANSMVIAASVIVPALTLGVGGFSIPWW